MAIQITRIEPAFEIGPKPNRRVVSAEEVREIYGQAPSEKPRLGRPPSGAAKVAVTLRLDPAVVERYQALGPDWRSRMAEKL